MGPAFSVYRPVLISIAVKPISIKKIKCAVSSQVINPPHLEFDKFPQLPKSKLQPCMGYFSGRSN
jgi:hypothetical protein